MHRYQLILICVLAPVVLVGCEPDQSVRLVGVKDETEANKIISILRQETGVDRIIKKAAKADRGVEWEIRVPPGAFDSANDILRYYNLPRQPRPSLANYPATSSFLGFSQTEDLARRQAALAGEIEIQLLAIPGVVDARAQVNLPDQSPQFGSTPHPPTVSVLVRYLMKDDADSDRPPVTPVEIQSLASSAAPDLRPENVTVVIKAQRMLTRTHVAKPLLATADSAGQFANEAAVFWTRERLFWGALSAVLCVLAFALMGIRRRLVADHRADGQLSDSDAGSAAVAS
jgi:type III secretory pathway lipoprotein EscJ